jgi:formylglycine-generating enzyme required for sulfatase activity
MNRSLALAFFGAFLAGMAFAAETPPTGMALIPAGSYASLFGANDAARSVAVPSYFLDLRPVTNAEFLLFVTANPNWRRSKVALVFAESGYLASWSGDLTLGQRAPDDAPVVQVSWFAARAYARWRGLRLPTIAEWERAASVGFTIENGTAEPAYRKAALKWLSMPFSPQLAAAGSGRPNIYGVRDLVDLVWEWVDDFNATGDASDSDDKNLVCGGAGVGVRDFSNYPSFARAEFRSSLNAPYAVPNLGFRCARSLSQ